LFTNIEPKAHINDVEVANDGSGMLFMPLEQEKIGTYFIPDMGNAPKWCAFLENMTEELEESKSTNLYDDYKFLTSADLDKLNASHLVGTNMLRAYMHGYFMEIRAYQKLLSVADPFAYEKYQKQQVAARMNKSRERIVVAKKPSLSQQVAVNQAYVDEIVKSGDKKGGKKRATDGEKMMHDDRWKSLFTDAEFTRDAEKAVVTKTGDGDDNSSEIDDLDLYANPPGKDLTKLFGAKNDDSSDAGEQTKK